MSSSDFIPGSEAELVTWSNRFDQFITATPTLVGLTALQAANYHTLNEEWLSSYAVSQSDATNSKAARILKNEAKRNLIREARMLAGIIQKYPGTTDAQRAELGLTVPHTPTPQPAPATAPMVEVVSVSGHIVRLRLHDATSTRRGRPAGVVAAAIYSFVGPVAPPPAEIHRWTSEGDVSRPHAVDIVFPTSVPDGARVYFCAQWMNAKMERSPASSPISTNLAGGGVSAEAAASEPVETQPQLKAA